jgi:GTPase SAR1 family protein
MSLPTDQPVAIVCVGMAGSGKTTFMQRINAHLHAQSTPPYVVNLDPAVHKVPFQANIDIRDSVNYKEVMRQYKLGPNGGILTSLNLFATKVDQVVELLEKRTAPPPPPPEPDAEGGGGSSSSAAKRIGHILVDTPGQIEVFVWSASGDILLGSLASSFPTVIAYVIDTPRSASTSTFMSNMLYACSILYKTKLPMILVFNKTDVKDAAFAKEWMTDFEAFQAALRDEEENGAYGGAEGEAGFAAQGSGYMGSLLNSMNLVLDEFYKHLKVVGVSSMTGHGVDDFFVAVREKAAEFETDYRPEMQRRRAQREKAQEKAREKQLGKMMADMAVDGGGSRKKSDDPDTVSDMEEDEDEDDDDDDDDADADGHGIGGLEMRYQEATAQAQAHPQGMSNADVSFVKYLHSSNIG